MTDQKLTYKSSGVNYDVMDKLKRMAQTAGNETVNNLVPKGFKEVTDSRGESASIIIIDNEKYLAFVQEGLGTKNLVADAVSTYSGKSHYDTIAQDTIAMIVNDLITAGAKPLTILAYWAAGSENWFKNEQRMEDLVNGWKKVCIENEIAWIGGETPTLAGIVDPNTIDLGGTAFGMINPSTRYTSPNKLQAGDAIVLFESSGIHANGLSLARKMVETLPDGYKTKISETENFGEALLKPTIIYSNLVESIFNTGVDIHYMVNITGHGWRKIMRHTKRFTYRMTQVPEVPEVLNFMKKQANMDEKEAYGNLNMGAGFAVFVGQTDVEKVLDAARSQGIKAYNAGVVEAGEKQVIIEPLNITYSSDSLQVRV